MEALDLELKIKEIIGACSLGELQRRTGIGKSHLSKFSRSETDLGLTKALRVLAAAGYELDLNRVNSTSLDDAVCTRKIHVLDDQQFYWDQSLKFWVVKTSGSDELEYYALKEDMLNDWPEFEQHLISG